MFEREPEAEREPTREREYDRKLAIHRANERGPDMDGEELVNGTAGGSSNVSDVTRESPGRGRLIGGIIVGLFAFLLIALPVAWVAGVLTALGGPGAPLAGALAWVYTSLLVILGIIAAFYAFTLLRPRVQ